ncbi:MAG: CDP-alcohol phosphatidyltransferase family protein [Ilumatobacteraceae bacterium]
MEERPGTSVWSGVATVPNLITLLRLCCLPVFLWLLLGRDDRAAAAWLLGGLGATDWVDGWVARRFDQVSEFGKMFDPTADRLLFLVAIVAILVDGSAPAWFCVLVLVREAAFGALVAVLTLFFGMQRFDVTYLGKWATFLLMFAFPGFVMGESTMVGDEFFTVAAWIIGPVGLALSWYTAFKYLPEIRRALAAGRGTPESAG